MNINKSLNIKFRPKSFEDFVGHKNIIKTIVNSLKSKKIHNCYLFYGPKGVGKTTISRLFAKGLNCIKGITSIPCLKCINCITIYSGISVDVMEIDAASKTKIEDIRILLESIYYLPVSMRYKVYIIDEVHMLSKYSFNALLKTLEESPDHVKFILATTNKNKIPDTILSRCMSFNLKNLLYKDILNYLVLVSNKEKITFDIEALKLISYYSYGSLRDSLVLMDQLLAFNGSNSIFLNDVNIILGKVKFENIIFFLENIFNKEKKKIFKYLKSFYISNIDYYILLDDLIFILHNLLLLVIYPNINSEILNISEVYYKILYKLSINILYEDIIYYYRLFLSSKKNFTFYPDKRIIFEFTIFRAIIYKNIILNNIK